MLVQDAIQFNKRAKKVFDNKGPVPAFDNVLFRNGFMYVRDLSIQIGSPAEGLAGLPDFMIDFKQFDKIISKVKTGDLSFTVDGNKVTMATAKGSFSFEMGSPEDFRLLSIKEPIKAEGLSMEDVKAIKDASNYVAKDELRPIMNDVYLDSSYAVGSDLHRILFKPTSERKEAILIPKKVCSAMGEASYSVERDREYVSFAGSDGYTLTFEETEGHFPKWQNVIPSDNDISFTLPHAELLETLELASLAAPASSKIVISVSQGVTIKAQDLDYNKEYIRHLSSKTSGEIKVGMNVNLLLDFIKREKADIYTFKATEPNRAVIINDYYLQMPMM